PAGGGEALVAEERLALGRGRQRRRPDEVAVAPLEDRGEQGGTDAFAAARGGGSYRHQMPVAFGREAVADGAGGVPAARELRTESTHHREQRRRPGRRGRIEM